MAWLLLMQTSRRCPPDMSTIFVTRHPGAKAWAEQEGVSVDTMVEHLELSAIVPGDAILGTLPVHVAAAVCERGARYFHLSMDLPATRRGTELSAEDMRTFGARLEEYVITRLVTRGSV